LADPQNPRKLMGGFALQYGAFEHLLFKLQQSVS
jgi:hypothetical protein